MKELEKAAADYWNNVWLREPRRITFTVTDAYKAGFLKAIEVVKTLDYCNCCDDGNAAFALKEWAEGTKDE